MLLFSFTLATPDGPRDEVIHVYSKNFTSMESCESTLKTRGWAFKYGAMLKEGYEVKLNSVKCAEQLPRAGRECWLVGCMVYPMMRSGFTSPQQQAVGTVPRVDFLKP
jgi:hypothetical protein